MSSKINKKDDINLVICGEAGQGIETVTEILIRTFKDLEINVFSSKEYMSRIRGGCNTSDIRISSKEISAPLDRIDFLVVLTKNGIEHVKNRISDETFIVYDSFLKLPEDNLNKTPVPITELSIELGGKILSNTISAGVILGAFGFGLDDSESYLKVKFSKKSEEIVQKNIEALKKGYEIGNELAQKENISVNVSKDQSVKDKILVTGNDAAGIGVIAGGCDFVGSYPMSPGTNLLTFLSKYSQEYKILVEQAEDEIAAINMGIGAWYAGSRAMVTTSGGGFALMTEGISLAGMLESPMVIHIAQRPGPATGLPTRTAQEDLELALYAGHGEFPRIILAPGTPEDTFLLAQNAFNLADKYQVPVFLLTDQYLLESFKLIKPLDIDSTKIEEHVVETDENYKRYQLTDSGLSPRGIPKYGSGLVNLDSDEHDEDGHITEDLELRVNMVDKRLKKLELIKDDIYPPELVGSKNYKTLIIGWGSTYSAIREAVEKVNSDDVAFLYIKQVYPLHDQVKSYIEKAQNTVIVENNATGQLDKLIRREFNLNIDHKVFKYNGLAFKADELFEKINNLIKVTAGTAN